MIKINWISDNNKEMLDGARNTVNKPSALEQPSRSWLKKLYLSEHSPIRKKMIDWTWKGLKSWISVHFVRHSIGISHMVSTQRDDRTRKNRDNVIRYNKPDTHSIDS